MPHGSRVSPDGLSQYSTCLMEDQLVVFDTRTLQVSRRFALALGKEPPIAVVTGHDEHAAHGGGTMDHGAMPSPTCSPTWAQPSAYGKKVCVACNKADEIVEIDRTCWTITRRLKTGRGPYNLAVTADGK